jgi:hypothetical protein
MRQSAGIPGAARAGAIAVLLPLLALAGCSGDSSKAMDEKLAAAQAAADRAVAAQHAAEAAAAQAAANPAPSPTPEAVSDTSPDNDATTIAEDNAPDQNSAPDQTGGSQVSMGGPGQAVAPNAPGAPGPG